MVKNPEVVSSSHLRGKTVSRNSRQWTFFALSTFSVIVLITFIKSLLPLIGMTFLLAFIWNQSQKNSRV